MLNDYDFQTLFSYGILHTRWGPTSKVISPFKGVITPVTYLFSAIYRGEISPFTTIVGAHLILSVVSTSVKNTGQIVNLLQVGVKK